MYNKNFCFKLTKSLLPNEGVECETEQPRKRFVLFPNNGGVECQTLLIKLKKAGFIKKELLNVKCILLKLQNPCFRMVMDFHVQQTLLLQVEESLIPDERVECQIVLLKQKMSCFLMMVKYNVKHFCSS